MQGYSDDGGGGAAVTLRSGALTVEIGFSGASAFAGQEIGVYAKFNSNPGWYVTAASIAFDHPGIARQSFEPEARRVYDGAFNGLGSLLLKFPFEAGRVVLPGKLRFQQCGDTVCEVPETITFELPLTIEPFVVPTPKR